MLPLNMKSKPFVVTGMVVVAAADVKRIFCGGGAGETFTPHIAEQDDELFLVV